MRGEITVHIEIKMELGGGRKGRGKLEYHRASWCEIFLKNKANKGIQTGGKYPAIRITNMSEGKHLVPFGDGLTRHSVGVMASATKVDHHFVDGYIRYW